MHVFQSMLRLRGWGVGVGGGWWRRWGDGGEGGVGVGSGGPPADLTNKC